MWAVEWSTSESSREAWKSDRVKGDDPSINTAHVHPENLEWKSLSLWPLPSKGHQFNRAEQPETEWEQDGQCKERVWTGTPQMTVFFFIKKKTNITDSAAHVSAVNSEEGNLSYAPALRLALTIYVPARIMELDSSVEKTLINLIMISIFFFPSLCLSFSSGAPLILSVRILWYSFAAFYFLTSYVKKVFSCKLLSHVLYSAKLVKLVSTTHTYTHTHTYAHSATREFLILLTEHIKCLFFKDLCSAVCCLTCSLQFY